VVGRHTFCACSNLSDVSLPSTVEGIDEGSFAYCGSLRTIKLPKGLKKIGRCTFDHDRSLQFIIVPSNVEHLENQTFRDCLDLKEVHLEHGIKTIGVH